MDTTQMKYSAYGRLSTSEDWRPITMGGQMFYADAQTLEGLVAQMRVMFQHIEYKVEAIK